MLIISSLSGMFFAILFVVVDFPIDLSEVGIIIYASTLFLIAIRNSTVSINKSIEELGDKYSLYVYIIHIAVNGVVGLMAKLVGVEELGVYLWCRPTIVAFASIVGSIFIYMAISLIKKQFLGHA